MRMAPRDTPMLLIQQTFFSLWSMVNSVKSYCALKMEIPEGHFRHILLFYFRKGKNAGQTHRKLCGVDVMSA